MSSAYGLMMYEAYINRVPLNAQIELLNKCNMHCKHCYIPSHEHMGLDTQKVKSLIDELQALGILNLVLTGGEIFLRDDIFDLIEYIRNKHISLTLLTNASLLNEEIIKRLSEYSIHCIGVSLYSLNANIYNEITNTNQYFDKVIENLMLLRKYNIKVRINNPLMKLNYFYDDVKLFCKNNGFDFRPSTIILPQTDWCTDNLALKLDEEKFIEVNVKLFDEEETKIEDKPYDLLKSFPNDPCPSLKMSISIDCLGNVYPCNSLNIKVGNVYENSVQEILESKTLNDIRSIEKDELEECRQCGLKVYCSRCPGLVYAESKNLYGCSQSVRQISEASKIAKERKKVKQV